MCSFQTEEINTGTTWIDGKPIYRKIFFSLSKPITTVPFVMDNIETLVSTKGTCKYGDGFQCFPIVSNSFDFQANYYFSNGNINFAWGKGLTLTISNIIIIFEYTKK